MTDVASTSLVRPAEQAREPRAFLATLTMANFGIYFALLTPAMVGLAYKVQSLVGTEAAAGPLGLVAGVGALFALLCNPLFGRLSDRTTSRFGRRRPWLVGGAVVGLGALTLIGAASSIPVVLVGWCLAQASLNATLAAVNATLPDQVPPARRGVYSGAVGVAMPLAILTGTVLVAAVPGMMLRFVVPGLVCLGLSVLFALTLPDRPLAAKPSDSFSVRDFFGSFYFNPRRHPDFGWAWLTKFLVMFGYAGVATWLPFYLQSAFGQTARESATTIATAQAAATAGMLLSAPLGGIVSDRIGKRRPLVTLAGGIMVVGLLLIAFASSPGVVVAGQAIIGVGAGAFLSVDLALATQVLPNSQDTAKDLGVLNMANALPQSLAPAIAPAIIAFGASTPLGGYPTWYLFGTVVAALGALLVYRIKGVA